MQNHTKAKSWFVMVIGERERHGPFEITRRGLILSLVCLIVIFAVIIAGGSWLLSRSYVINNKALTEELVSAQQTIDLISREKGSFLEEIEGLKAEIDTLRAKQKKIVIAAEKKTATVNTEPFVSVEEVQITHNADNKTLKIRFIIRNQSTEEGYISGYVFIILNPAPGSSALRKIYPAGELVDGVPQSYEKGENFSIARFKYIEGVFPSISDRNQYGSFSVLAYADDGALRLKKELSL